MKIKDGYLLREVAGESIVVAIDSAALDFNGLITLNGTGTFLWKLLMDGAGEDKLLRAMLAEYKIDQATAKKDIREYLSRLEVAKLLDLDK